MKHSYYLNSSLGNMSPVVSLDLDTSWAAKSLDLSQWYQLQDSYKLRLQNKALELKKEDDKGAGRVRQLFEERRGAGRDKSYPLEPLKRRVVSLDRLNNYKNDSTQKEHEYEQRLTKSHKVTDSTVRIDVPKRLPNLGGASLQSSFSSSYPESTTSPSRKVSEMDATKRNFAKKPQSTIGSLSKGLSGLKVSTTNDGVVEHKPSTTQRRPTPLVRSADSKTTKLPKPSTGSAYKATDRDPIRENVTSPTKIHDPISKSGYSVFGSPTRSATPSSAGSVRSTTKVPEEKPKPPPQLNDGRVPCKICHRPFLPDRIPVHEKICSKSKTKKRKPFDPVKHRLVGTEAEDYIKTIKSNANKKPAPVKKSNWRKTHEEFVNSIRAAKEATNHLAKGGKLSDLPPPPPSDTSHYTQCPHCSRKFNQAAAERHIPKCADMRHNKTKPNAAKTTKPSLMSKTVSRTTRAPNAISKVRN